jgi:predicted small lipoprotein YifL
VRARSTSLRGARALGRNLWLALAWNAALLTALTGCGAKSGLDLGREDASPRPDADPDATPDATPDIVPRFSGVSGSTDAVGAMWRVADVTTSIDVDGSTACEVELLHSPDDPAGYDVTDGDIRY